MLLWKFEMKKYVGIVLSYHELQWNLSVTTTFLIKFITCDLFSNVF